MSHDARCSTRHGSEGVGKIGMDLTWFEAAAAAAAAARPQDSAGSARRPTARIVGLWPAPGAISMARSAAQAAWVALMFQLEHSGLAAGPGSAKPIE